MSFLKRYLVLVVSLFFCGILIFGDDVQKLDYTSYEEVTATQLKRNPSRYNGKRVSLKNTTEIGFDPMDSESMVNVVIKGADNEICILRLNFRCALKFGQRGGKSIPTDYYGTYYTNKKDYAFILADDVIFGKEKQMLDLNSVEKGNEEKQSAGIKKVSVETFFPTTIGARWTYANNDAEEFLTVVVLSIGHDKSDGTDLYLFEEQWKGVGATRTLYSIKENKIVKIVSKNIMGKYMEYEKPFPIELTTPNEVWQYDDRGDILNYRTILANCRFDGKKFEDCILVEEKLLSGDKIIRNKKSYFAKGIGLVYVTILGSDGQESVYMKLMSSTLLKK